MGILKRVEKFELHHYIISFLIIILATILITRFLVYYVVDPNPRIWGVELHHFDYGLLLLTITSLLMLFGKKHFKIYLVLVAVSLGLIIDELWYVKKQMGGNNPMFYNPSFVYAISLSIFLVLIMLLVIKLTKSKAK